MIEVMRRDVGEFVWKFCQLNGCVCCTVFGERIWLDYLFSELTLNGPNVFRDYFKERS